MIKRTLSVLLVTLLITNFTTQIKTPSGLSISFENGKYKFTEKHTQLVKSIIEQSEKKVRKLLPTLPKHIKVTVSITDEDVD